MVSAETALIRRIGLGLVVLMVVCIGVVASPKAKILVAGLLLEVLHAGCNEVRL